MLAEMQKWAGGNWLEKRAAAAAICEPALLREKARAEQALQMLDDVTASILAARRRGGPEFEAFRRGLGYCWSVAVAALPPEGKKAMEKWLGSEHKDVRWIMRENLKKNRLTRMDPDWVETWAERLRGR